jgi:hypothetical protein
MEEEFRTANSEVGTKSLVVVQVETTEIVVEQPEALKVVQCFHFIFYHFTRISRMKSRIWKG